MPTTAEMIRQNANDTVQVIDTMSALLNKFASDNCELQKENDALRAQTMCKSASDAPVFNEKLMHRAASAVCSSYGSNPSLTPEVLEAVWMRDPNKMLDNICKMASDLASAAIAGDHIGVNKEETIANNEHGMRFGSDHQSLFESCYNQ